MIQGHQFGTNPNPVRDLGLILVISLILTYILSYIISKLLQIRLIIGHIFALDRCIGLYISLKHTC